MTIDERRKELQRQERFLQMDISENRCRLRERRTTVEGLRISRQNIEYSASKLAAVRTELLNLSSNV